MHVCVECVHAVACVVDATLVGCGLWDVGCASV